LRSSSAARTGQALGSLALAEDRLAEEVDVELYAAVSPFSRVIAPPSRASLASMTR
jgi:hypothetical protein